MDLNDIVNRDLSAPITQQGSLFVIREYVKRRKGVEIDPQVSPHSHPFVTLGELNKMIEMTLTAIIWFRNND